MRTPMSPLPGQLARALVISIAGFIAAPLAPAQDVERTMRVFDCEFLVARKPDLPGPDLLPFLPGSDREVELEEEAEEFTGILDPDRLVDMIRANVQPDSWHHEKNTIRFAQGKLVVVQTPEVQDQIAALLEELRGSRTRMIHLVGRVLSVRTDHFATWHAAAARGGGTGAILTPQALERLLDVKPGDDRVRVLATVSMPADSDQLVHAGAVRKARFIYDLDAEIAEEAINSQPILDDLLTGTMLRIRPSLVGDGLVLLSAEFAHAVRQGEMKTLETGVGRIDLPVRSLQAAATSLLIPEHHAALLAVSDAGEGGRVIVFLVQPQVVGGEKVDSGSKPAAVPDSAARELRVYNTRLLTARILDRPCPFLRQGEGGVEINLMADEEEEGGAVFGAAPEETPAGVNLEADELVELIRTGIEEDSWSNTRNRIEVSGDLLIVVQKPAVHEAIARFLAKLRARRGVLVTTEVWALGVRNDRVAALIPNPAELGAPLSEEAIARVHQAVADGSAQLLRQAEVTGFNRQRAHAFSVLERPVIAGVEVEVAKKATTVDPHVRALRSGFVVDVRPSLTGDAKTIGLDLYAAFVSASEPKAVAYREGQPYVVHEYDTEAANLFASMLLPDGGAMAFLRGTVPGRPDHQLLFLVTARATRVTGR